MKKICLLILFFYSVSAMAQINFTANDEVPTYDGTFGFGVNPGSNSGWDDEAEADIAAGNPDFGVSGAGCNTLRPPLPEWFLEFWGYDIRLDEYQYFETLGIRDLTVFIGFPSDEHRDPNYYCPDDQSELFDNMYLPIWDGGANGTPVNDDNYYARYLFDMVNIYKDHVKFWEVWNEPDLDYSASGYLDPGQPGNWWENVPDPCDYKLQAPVYHYIRLLRISYEVIKYVDPEAFVAVGGLGYESFLDIILRYSDNPNHGIINAQYPLTGGAYFDALSYHSYPHFSLKDWNNDIGGFEFFRHSDAAKDEVIIKKNEMEAVLETYGYDGNTYPEKVWLITESNVPAANFDPDYFGSISGQRNFIIKTVVACQKNNILQYHVYKLAEDYPVGQGFNEFDRMGLYENIDDVVQYEQILTEEGIAYKTTSDAIGGAFYDAEKTTELNLPDHIDGAAFLHPDDSYTFVLWAKTTIDNSEFAIANYSFPASMNISFLEKKNWNFSQTNALTEISPNNISLTGDPVFLKGIPQTGLPPDADFEFELEFISPCGPFTISFSDHSTNAPNSWTWSFPGGSPNASNQQNPVVTYPEPGFYSAGLLVSNDFGNDGTSISFEIVAAEIITEIYSELCFGDEMIINGTVYNEDNPSGTEVFENGSANGCDSTVIINLTFDEMLESSLEAVICDGETYQFGSETLSESGIYTFETTSTGGCDSIAILDLTVEEATILDIEVELCKGDEYNGIEYFESTVINEIISSINGCDSLIITTDIIVKPTFFTEIEVTIPEGETYTVGNSTYDESGVYYDILIAQNGCDSIIELTLTVEIVDAVFDNLTSESIDLQCFPNPFSRKVNISFLAPEQSFEKLIILDAHGKQLHHFSMTNSHFQRRHYFSLVFENQPKGVYWCQISLKEGVFIQKLVLL